MYETEQKKRCTRWKAVRTVKRRPAEENIGRLVEILLVPVPVALESEPDSKIQR